MAGLANSSNTRIETAPAARAIPDAERPGWFDTLGAATRLEMDDTGWTRTRKRRDAYQGLYDALPDDAKTRITPIIKGDDEAHNDDVWLEFQSYRGRGITVPTAFPQTRAEFDANLLEQQAARAGRDDVTLAKAAPTWANTGVRLAGSMAGSFTDPLQVVTLPFGGGAKTVIGTVAKGALINGSIQALETPVIAKERAALGRDYSTEEAIYSIGGAALFGGALDGTGRLIGDAVRDAGSVGALTAQAREALLAKAIPLLPEKLRPTMTRVEDIPDEHWPDIAEAVIGRGNMTGEERGAAAVVRAHAETKAAFGPWMQGEDSAAGMERLGATLQALLSEQPVPKANVSRETMRGTTGAAGTGWAKVATDVADATGLSPAQVAAVMSYETGGSFSPSVMGGKDGKYMGLIQFGPAERAKYGISASSTPDQWSAAIIGFMRDRGFKRGMGIEDFYSTINAGRPGRYGASDGNGTVLTHVQKILGEHMDNARRWLAQGGIINADASGVGTLDGALSSVDARLAALDAEQAGMPRASAALADAAPSSPTGLISDVASASVVSRETMRGTSDAMPAQLSMPPELQARIPEIRAYVNDAKRPSLQPAKIAEALGIGESEARQLLLERVVAGHVLQVGGGKKPIRYMRKPVFTGPEDLLAFIARRGGIKDELSARGQPAHDLKTIFAQPGGKGSAFIPGAGPLVRDSGMTLDMARELAAEAGYLHSVAPNMEDALGATSVRDFLALIERAWTGKHKIMADSGLRIEGAPEKVRVDPEFADHAHNAAATLGVSLNDDDLKLAMEMFDGDFEGTIERLVNLQISDSLLAAFAEAGDARYAIPDDWGDPFPDASHGGGAAQRADGSGVDAGNARESSGGPEKLGRDAGPPDAARQGLDQFDDPESGAGVASHTESLIHDLRAIIDEGGTFGSEINIGLDENGDVRNIADWLAEFDGDASAIDAIKGCL